MGVQVPSSHDSSAFCLTSLQNKFSKISVLDNQYYTQ